MKVADNYIRLLPDGELSKELMVVEMNDETNMQGNCMKENERDNMIEVNAENNNERIIDHQINDERNEDETMPEDEPMQTASNNNSDWDERDYDTRGDNEGVS